MAAKGINDRGASEKLRKALELALEFDPVNFGDMRTGNRFDRGIDLILENIKDTSIVHAVFDTKDKLEGYLRVLKDADLGMSTVVSGNFKETLEVVERLGLCAHTALMSLGVFGRLDLLPPEEILEITTMCGHHMVPSMLVKKVIEDVRCGKITAEMAGEKLARQCICGIFNPKRAARLINRFLNI
jgi:hypothetical protein